MDVTTHPSISPAKRPRRRWWRLLFPLALLLLIGWWWSTQPKSYHRVARSTTADITLVPCRQGYLTIEAGNAFVLRDWTTGAEKWRVRAHSIDNASWSIGEQGDVFAAISRSYWGVHVRTWRNGLPVFDDTLFPDHFKQDFGLRVLNNNRVMVWAQHANNTAVLIDGTKIAARGNLYNSQGGTGHAPDYVSPDGTTALCLDTVGITYSTLIMRNGRIRSTASLITTPGIRALSYPPYNDTPDMLTGGYYINRDDQLCNSKGPRPGQGTWSTDTITPGGVWVFQSQGKQGRVYAPSTGDQWMLTTPGPCQGGDATMDGRWALAHFSPGQDAAVSRLVEALQQIPGLENFPNPANADFLGLYERPGKLRALLKVDIDNWAPDFSAENSWWFPSPDGHGYVINIFDGTRGACVLFRW